MLVTDFMGMVFCHVAFFVLKEGNLSEKIGIFYFWCLFDLL